MSPWVFVLLFSAMAGIALLAFFVRSRIEKQRAEAFRRLGDGLGLVPAGEKAPLPEPATRFPLMSAGHRRKATHLLTGALDGMAALVFDYRYTTGGGKSSHTHRFTVVVFPDAGRGALPDFELSPERLVAKIGQVFGYKDIDFFEDEAFSKRYLLRGANESAIRTVFDSELRALLRGNAAWRIQTRGGSVLIASGTRRWATEELPARLAEARRLAGALAR